MYIYLYTRDSGSDCSMLIIYAHASSHGPALFNTLFCTLCKSKKMIYYYVWYSWNLNISRKSDEEMSCRTVTIATGRQHNHGSGNHTSWVALSACKRANEMKCYQCMLDFTFKINMWLIDSCSFHKVITSTYTIVIVIHDILIYD